MAEIDEKTGKGVGTVTVSLSKLTEGVGIIFGGVVRMLEALDAGTSKAIADEVARYSESLSAAAKADDVHADTAVTAAADTPVPDESVNVQKEDMVQAETPHQAPVDSTPGLTVDDITRIVVQKMKQNPGINDKIRALVNAHGAEKVTELASSEYEAFLTDLSQL